MPGSTPASRQFWTGAKAMQGFSLPRAGGENKLVVD
jgi:hypothetical protein